MLNKFIFSFYIIFLILSCSKSEDDESKEIEIQDDEVILDSTLYAYVPDDEFESFLIDKGYDNIMDNHVLRTSIKDVKELNFPYFCGLIGSCTSLNIEDLTGIEAFINLETLVLSHNFIISLNLSKNRFLKYLDAANNHLTSINISNLDHLEDINLSSNRLINIDISRALKLEKLNLTSNQLENIDISKNPMLKNFSIGYNNLTNLDLSNSILLEIINCSSNQIININVTKNKVLKNLSINYNQVIQNLDVTQNTHLVMLDCGNTKITSLDISKNILLERLDFRNNLLTKLDVSKNQKLSSMDLMSFVDILSNPPETCIKVNQTQLNVINSNTPLGWVKDPNDRYSLICN